MRRLLVHFAVLSTLCATPVSAQEPSARERFALSTDTAELRRVEKSENRLDAGFAALRLWELTHDGRLAGRARRHFDAVTKREPDNAWAHYGHALSLRADIERSDGTIVLEDALARGLGFDATSRARRALERAVELDPSLPGAADLLTAYAVDTRDGSALELSRRAFESAAASEHASTSDLIGLARSAREMFDYDVAADAASRAAAHGGPLFAASHLEMAKALAGVGGREREAGEAWHAAIAAAEDSLLDRIWNDVDMVATPVELRRWNGAMSVAAKRAALTALWELRGPLSGMSPNERVGEHYARVNYAWQNFRRVGKVGAPPRGEDGLTASLRFQRIDMRYDDRGIIYIRHGRPTATYGFPLQNYHVWMYRGEDGNPVSYHFGMFGGQAGYSKDYVLLRFLPCPIDPEVAILDPRLAALVHSCNSKQSLSAELRLDAEDALATDTHNPVIDVPIRYAYDWYSFRGANGTTDLVVALGVPLANIPAGDPALRIDATVIDTAARPARVAQADARTPPIARRSGPDEILRAHLTLHASPSDDAAYRVHLRDAANSAVGMMYGGTIDVRDYTGDTVMVSDIALTEQTERGNYERNGNRLALAPTQVFEAGSFRTYYEIYNLTPGESYRTELSIERVRKGITGAVTGLFSRGDGVRLHFDDVVPASTGSTLVQFRDIDAPLDPGAYVLRLTITSGTSKITRERRFTIPE